MQQLMREKIPTDYEKIFHPQKVAIVGVSTEGQAVFNFGSSILKAIKAMGFAGQILPVNPKGGVFAGLHVYKSVEDIPDGLDFAVIAVASRFVPEVLEACRKKGAAAAEIVSSGFSEIGTKEGADLEQQIKEIAAKGIRVIGPNCFGVYCPKSGLTFAPGPDLSRESGSVAFLSQSGGMSVDFAHVGKWMGIRFSKIVSFGNGVDLRETELLHYLACDPETKVIVMYVEGIGDGEDFFRAIKSAARQKPVVVFKGGLSSAGQRAVASHTASMGGNRVIWQSVLRQVNAVAVQDMEEMAQVSLALALLPAKTYKAISVIGGGGALGVNACDTAESFGIEIPLFPAALQEQIGSFLPKPGSSTTNPVDVGNPFVPPRALKEVLSLAAKDSRVDLQIIISLLHHYKVNAGVLGKTVQEVAPYEELAQVLREVKQATGKPIIVVLPNLKRGIDDLDVAEMLSLARKEFVEHGLPVYDEFHHAIRAIGHVNKYYEVKGAKNE